MEPEFEALGFPQFGESMEPGEIPAAQAPVAQEEDGWFFPWIGNFFRPLLWGPDKPAQSTESTAQLPSGEVKKAKKFKKKGAPATAQVVAAPPAAAADPAPAAAAK